MKSIKTIFFLTICLAGMQHSFAQTATELLTTSRSFTQQGDYSNAILVLNKATQLQPKSLEVTKALAMNYYLNGDNNKALEIIKTTLDREDADDQCYQIAGNIYKQLGQVKECDKLFRKGIKKFPLSGPMYNELGGLLWQQQNAEAIKQWEKGIEIDPNYAKNYFDACKYYYLTEDKVWSILYGEIFVNMEPLSGNAAEVKTILAESYKQLFINTATENKDKNKFVAAFIETISKQGSIANNGINAETLTMIRARFILDWQQEYATKFPFKLFDLQQQLLQEGMFDAYNQWIFGPAQNMAAYQNWITTHSIDYNEFSRFQKGRIFKLPSAQYYRYLP